MNVIKFPIHKTRNRPVLFVENPVIIDINPTLMDNYFKSECFEREYKEYCDTQEKRHVERYKEELYFSSFDYSFHKDDEQ